MCCGGGSSVQPAQPAQLAPAASGGVAVPIPSQQPSIGVPVVATPVAAVPAAAIPNAVPVALHKPSPSAALGLDLAGGAGEDVVITKITPGHAAARSGQLFEQDRVFAINNVACSAGAASALAMLTSLSGNVLLSVLRPELGVPEAANFHKPTAQTKLGVDFVDGGGLVRVRAVAAGFPAAGILFPGDVVDAINANPPANAAMALALLVPLAGAVTVTVRRPLRRLAAVRKAGVYDKLGVDFVDAPGLGVVVGNVFPGFPAAQGLSLWEPARDGVTSRRQPRHRHGRAVSCRLSCTTPFDQLAAAARTFLTPCFS